MALPTGAARKSCKPHGLHHRIGWLQRVNGGDRVDSQERKKAGGKSHQPSAFSLTLGLETQGRCLLQLDFSACFFQSSFGFVSCFFGNSFQNHGRSAVNYSLGFFQAQTGQFTYCLDHVYFLLASFGQHDVEFGLLFNNGSSSSWASGSSGSGNAEFFFESFDQLNNLQNRHFSYGVEDIVLGDRHCCIS
ncbi:hypothetical protein EMIT0357P_140009 [Pseudomonas marginalis]